MEDKLWGRTAPVARETDHHIDRIEVLKGGYCSVHKHLRKVNVFHVLKGRLYVKVFSEQGGAVYARHMLAGQSCVVEVGQWHQFYAQQEACEALEVYLPGTDGVLDADDIERHPKFAVGGVGNYAELASMLRDAFVMEAQYVGR